MIFGKIKSVSDTYDTKMLIDLLKFKSIYGEWKDIVKKNDIDDKKTKIGYEIPFTREFYKYVAPRKSDEIYASLLELDRQEQELMAKIIGK